MLYFVRFNNRGQYHTRLTLPVYPLDQSFSLLKCKTSLLCVEVIFLCLQTAVCTLQSSFLIFFDVVFLHFNKLYSSPRLQTTLGFCLDGNASFLPVEHRTAAAVYVLRPAQHDEEATFFPAHRSFETQTPPTPEPLDHTLCKLT